MDGWIEWTKFSWLYIKKTQNVCKWNEPEKQKKLIRPKVYNKNNKTTNIYMCVCLKLIWHIRYIQQQQPIYRIKLFFFFFCLFALLFYLFFCVGNNDSCNVLFCFGRRGCRFIYIKCVKEERRRKKKKKIVLHKLQPAINYNNTLCVSFFVWNEMKWKWK